MAKVLLIDDDEDLIDLVKDLFSFEHHAVEIARTGSLGLEKLQFFEYDLVVLDWQLPAKSGVEILKEFRGQGGKTPIIMLTGLSAIDAKLLAFGAGADDYVTKPFHVKELYLQNTTGIM